MNAPSPTQSGEAIDAGALLGEAVSAAAEVTQGTSETAAPDTAGPEKAEGDGSEFRQQPADSGSVPDSSAPSGSGGPRDADILVKAHRLFEEAVEWLGAMEALIGARPGQATPSRAEPSRARFRSGPSEALPLPRARDGRWYLTAGGGSA